MECEDICVACKVQHRACHIEEAMYNQINNIICPVNASIFFQVP